jgi:hypothetical protein
VLKRTHTRFVNKARPARAEVELGAENVFAACDVFPSEILESKQVLGSSKSPAFAKATAGGQAPKQTRALWDLVFGISLELGAWNLELWKS